MKIDGINADLALSQRNGVFVTLLVIVNGMPSKIGFKHWEALGGTLDSDARVRYVYGYIKCHEKYVSS